MLARDTEQTRDLVQATCIRTLEKAAIYHPDTRLDRWLMTMMMNVWRNQLRAARARRKWRGWCGKRPELRWVRPCGNEYFASQVLTAVAALPEAQRETVLLVYLEDWTCAEAVHALDVAIGTVMSRLAAAGSRLAGTHP